MSDSETSNPGASAAPGSGNHDLLKRSQVFTGLSDEQLTRVLAIGETCSFEENCVIVEEDKQGVDCFFVLDGRVDIEIRSPFGSATQKIATIKRGEMFGELSLVDGFLRSATARTSDAVEALQFTNAKLEELMEDDPRIGFTIMRNLANVLSSRIRNTNMKLRNALSDILY
ncbi:MAG: Crp/Fnr family transcriptional regulator [Planctomycetes bacterium]|nr:Crp/Fnr family transcriptional regulator [Planctomycetota bacterium]